MWFSVRLLFESAVSDGGTNQPLCEENIKLVQAQSEEEARRKAQAIGLKEQIEYENSEGAAVEWRFIDVLEIQELCESEIYDGVEVYSRLSWKNKSEE